MTTDIGDKCRPRHTINQGSRGRDPNDQSTTLHQVHFGAIWHDEMQPSAHDEGRRGAFSLLVRRYPARSHGNGA